jgi:hypothetical protein
MSTRSEAADERVTLTGALDIERDSPSSSSSLKRRCLSWPTPLCNVPTVLASFFAILFFALFVGARGRLVLLSQLPESPDPPSAAHCTPSAAGPEYIVVPTAAIATDESRCSAIGRDVLAENGASSVLVKRHLTSPHCLPLQARLSTPPSLLRCALAWCTCTAAALAEAASSSYITPAVAWQR